MQLHVNDIPAGSNCGKMLTLHGSKSAQQPARRRVLRLGFTTFELPSPLRRVLGDVLQNDLWFNAQGTAGIAGQVWCVERIEMQVTHAAFQKISAEF